MHAQMKNIWGGYFLFEDATTPPSNPCLITPLPRGLHVRRKLLSEAGVENAAAAANLVAWQLPPDGTCWVLNCSRQPQQLLWATPREY